MNNPYEYLKEYEGKKLNYKKEFCPLTKIEYKKAGAKTRQFEQLSQYMELEIDYSNIIIVKVYDENEMNLIENKRYFNSLNNMSKDKNRYNQFNISKKDAHKSGIYKIQLNHIIYIGQTNNFQKRFKNHWDRGTFEVKNILKNGATFEVVKIIENENDRLIEESKLIQKYLNDSNYICLNIQGKGYKIKYKQIRIKESDYNKVIKILEENNIEYK